MQAWFTKISNAHLFSSHQALGSSIRLRELQQQSGLLIGAIQKEIAHLKELDLVIAERDLKDAFAKGISDDHITSRHK